MAGKRTWLAIHALWIAFLACSLPAGQPPVQAPDLAGTITAQSVGLAPPTGRAVSTATLQFTGVPSLTPTASALPVNTPTEGPPPASPTRSLPAVPDGLKASYRCTLSSSPFLHNDVLVRLTWRDNASDEDGYYIFRDGVLVATLDANSSSFSDDTTMLALIPPGSPAPHITYSIQAFNAAGKSQKISKSISCFD